MRWVREESGAGLHRSQDADYAFFPQIDVEVRFIGHIADERCGLMSIEIVQDEMPLHNAGVRVHSALDMSEFLKCGGAAKCLTLFLN